MRKQLTPTEKLYVIREARRMYMEGDFYFLCPIMVYAIVSALGIRLAVKYDDLPVVMPELYEYKPSHKVKDDPWWPQGEKEPRLAVLDNLEARYYGQTTWWSRVWFKIKNTRIWKS